MAHYLIRDMYSIHSCGIHETLYITIQNDMNYNPPLLLNTVQVHSRAEENKMKAHLCLSKDPVGLRMKG